MAGLSPEDVIELKHGLAGLAEVVWGYYSELKKQGFSDEQALRLTIGWQRSMYAGGSDS